MNLSEEQEAAKGAVSFGSSVAVSAGAGTGKTTFCVAAADVCDDPLYLAFNRAAKDDAQRRFSLRTRIKTAHGLAFDSEGRCFKQRLVTSVLDLRRGYAPMVSAAIARCFGPRQRGEAETIAHCAFDAVNAFLASADRTLSPERHVEDSPYDATLIAEIASQVATTMLDRNGALPVTHDAYLKVFQLSRPTIRAKTIIFDEAQDASEAMLDVVLSQQAQQIFVGDKRQGIYSWRGAVNAFAYLGHLDLYHLLQCWRFGPRVAAAANAILTSLSETALLVGAGKYDTVVSYAPCPEPPFDGTTALLGRTTLGVFSLACQAAGSGERLAFIGGHERILGWFQAAYDLSTVGHTRHPAFAMFRSYRDLVAFAQFAAGAQYAPSVRAVERYRDDLPSYLRLVRSCLVPENEATAVASTIHQYKGREAANVYLADDVGNYASFQERDRRTYARFSEEEANIAYVGVTRAQRFLDYSDAASNVLASCNVIEDIKALVPILCPGKPANTIFEAARALDGVPIPYDVLDAVQSARRQRASQEPIVA